MIIGSLCTGYGGLDHAVMDVLGGELAWVADPDPGASKILAHHHPSIPNLGDITQVDWSTIPPVDVLTAGFPCQPVSLAGRRDGTDDERWLFDDICNAISRMVTRPRLLVFENVPGLLTANRGHAMARVVHGLAALGYVGSWRVVAASDVGAPHRRERVFIAAWLAADSSDFGCQRPRATRDGRGRLANHPSTDTKFAIQPRRREAGDVDRAKHGPWPTVGASVSDRSTAFTDPQGDGRRERRSESTRVEGRLCATSGSSTDWGKYETAIRNWENIIGRPAPDPTQVNRTGRFVLAPPFVEWMMGLSRGWVTEVPGLSRAAQLRALGNGVVPQQGAYALRLLLNTAQGVTVEA